MLMIMGLFGPFIEAKAIVAVYEEGRRLAKQRKYRENIRREIRQRESHRESQIWFGERYMAG